MFKPGVIVAEKNPFTRARVARMLSANAHHVETTGSAAELMQALLRGRFSVVVLGDGLEEGLSVAVLVRLLKSCNPDVTIILLADEIPQAEARRIRQQGIFYHSNRPACGPGWDELQLAVACACKEDLTTPIAQRVH